MINRGNIFLIICVLLASLIGLVSIIIERKWHKEEISDWGSRYSYMQSKARRYEQQASQPCFDDRVRSEDVFFFATVPSNGGVKWEVFKSSDDAVRFSDTKGSSLYLIERIK